jgi:hypothetical protein
VPFFRWLLAQPELAAGRFHTTYLDELLVTRAGRSFAEPDGEAEDIAMIGAALQSVLSRGAPAGSSARPPAEPAAQRWKTRARADALRR